MCVPEGLVWACIGLAFAAGGCAGYLWFLLRNDHKELRAMLGEMDHVDRP